MPRFSIVLIFMLCLPLATAAEKPAAPAVESLMTPEDFRAAGLDRLTDAERAHLSEWVERYRGGVVVGPAPRKTSEQLAEDKKIEIVAKVIPSFTGWSGKTIFRLDNGQIWQQRQTGKMRYSGGDSTVIIAPNMLGMYMLKHPESKRAVGVKRIK